MNDELQEKLVKWLGKTENAVEQAIDFSAEQIPDVINQLVTYNLVMSAACVGIGTLLLIVVPFSWYVSRDFVGDGKVVSRLFGTAVPAFTCSALVCHNLPTLLKCYVAPKLFVLEYLSNIVK